MVKEKLILFDIDSTLFDTQKYILTFIKKIDEEIITNDIDNFIKIAFEIYQANRGRFFVDINGFSNDLSKRINQKIDSEKIRKIVFDEKLIESCLYSETIFALQKLSKDKDLIFGILSAGEIDFQLLKIKLIKDFINEKHIHIVAVDKKNQVAKILKKYRGNLKIYLIDDLLEILKTAKSFNPNITVIWSKRGAHINDQDENIFTPDFTITSLLELTEIINKI